MFRGPSSEWMNPNGGCERVGILTPLPRGCGGERTLKLKQHMQPRTGMLASIEDIYARALMWL